MSYSLVVFFSPNLSISFIDIIIGLKSCCNSKETFFIFEICVLSKCLFFYIFDVSNNPSLYIVRNSFKTLKNITSNVNKIDMVNLIF